MNDWDEELERKRSVKFVDNVIPDTRAQLKVLSKSYQVGFSCVNIIKAFKITRNVANRLESRFFLIKAVTLVSSENMFSCDHHLLTDKRSKKSLSGSFLLLSVFFCYLLKVCNDQTATQFSITFGRFCCFWKFARDQTVTQVLVPSGRFPCCDVCLRCRDTPLSRLSYVHKMKLHQSFGPLRCCL